MKTNAKKRVLRNSKNINSPIAVELEKYLIHLTLNLGGYFELRPMYFRTCMHCCGTMQAHLEAPSRFLLYVETRGLIDNVTADIDNRCPLLHCLPTVILFWF